MTEAEKERAAVVAWLRRSANLTVNHPVKKPQFAALERSINESIASVLTRYAEAIERGDHLKGTGDE